MKKTLVALAITGSLLGLSACGTEHKVTGTIKDKYIEDFAEYTVVLEEASTKNLHHFEVDPAQWSGITVGQQYTHTTTTYPEED